MQFCIEAIFHFWGAIYSNKTRFNLMDLFFNQVLEFYSFSTNIDFLYYTLSNLRKISTNTTSHR